MPELSYMLSRQRISGLADSMQLSLNEQAWKFLECRTSCRVLAAPGSGKTTLLVLKLLALAYQWNTSGAGMLVLSHTNVARAEVEKRLKNYPAAASILRYPHFIGTFQAFVDRFIAIPQIRHCGMPSVPPLGADTLLVDDDEFGRRALRLFYNGPFPQAKGWGRNRRDIHEIISGLEYTYSPSQGLYLGDERLPSATSDTTKQLTRLKARLSAEGVYRYHDMFAIAEYSLASAPKKRSALCCRFPVVFVDETQDNGQHIERLLEALFEGKCVIQQLGDPNQAIYSDGALPLTRCADVSLNCSHRFGGHIAQVATRLATRASQNVRGLRDECSSMHSIFIFDQSTVDRVLPAFGDLVHSKWGTDVSKLFVCAVAGRIRQNENGTVGEATTIKNCPYSAQDYWSQFVPADAKTRTYHANLDEAMKAARASSIGTNGGHAVYRVCMSALRGMYHRATGTWISQSEVMKKLTREQTQAVRECCARIAHGDIHFGAGVLAGIGRAFEPKGAALLEEYLSRPSEPDEASETKGAVGQSIYVHRVGDACIPIRVSSIHAAKGETHDATIVLETMQRVHDLKSALPHLLGKKSALELKSEASKRIRNLFVAASRPRHLLCLAMHAEHLEEKHREQLRREGWQLVDLTQADDSELPRGAEIHRSPSP